MLTEGEVPSHDRRVALIGLAAYEQAGGGVRRDLFADDAGGGVTLTDPACWTGWCSKSWPRRATGCAPTASGRFRCR